MSYQKLECADVPSPIDDIFRRCDMFLADAYEMLNRLPNSPDIGGGHPGAWDEKKPWNGWWGSNPPFHHPVFVLTQHAREPLELEGGTTFTFVTDGIEAALERARAAARGKDVSLAGGAKAAQQYLAAGLVDEMEIHLVATLLGSGERLFEDVGDSLHGLELVRTVAAPRASHLKFERR